MAAKVREKSFLSLFRSRLGMELILSHLLATLGSLMLLTVVMLFATRNYFISTQQKQIAEQASYAAQYYEALYTHQRIHVPPNLEGGDNLSLLAIMDRTTNQVVLSYPPYLDLTQSEVTTIQEKLTQTLANGQTDGFLQDDSQQHAFSGYYVSLPLTSNGQVFGALLYADPQVYPTGFEPDSFLANISTSILLTGLCVALVTVFLSLLFIRRLTSPLIAMKKTVDTFSEGSYRERIAAPFADDEFGQLALSFNHMASQIEENILKLQQQEAYRRDLTANIAHDLATPLASIRGFSEALDDNVIEDEQGRHDTYKIIIREIERLSHMVQDVQQLSSLEAGQIRLDRSPVDLSVLVNQTIEVIEPQCEEAGITIENKMAQEGAIVYADSNRLIQVLLNIFDNARFHTPDGGTISIANTTSNGWTILRISDTGHGIDPADLPRIFDRFYRADPARTRRKGSSGLGLAIVKQIMHMHGGQVWAESTPGQGTTIALMLPAGEEIEQNQAASLA